MGSFISIFFYTWIVIVSIIFLYYIKKYKKTADTLLIQNSLLLNKQNTDDPLTPVLSAEEIKLWDEINSLQADVNHASHQKYLLEHKIGLITHCKSLKCERDRLADDLKKLSSDDNTSNGVNL